MPLFFIIESGIFVLHRKWGRPDTPANAENDLCRTQYGDEPRFRCFSIAPLSPRQQKWDNSWRNSSERKRGFCRGDHRSPLRESVCFSYPVLVWQSFRLGGVRETGAQRNTNPVGATSGRPRSRVLCLVAANVKQAIKAGDRWLPLRGRMRSGIGVTEGGRRRTNIRGGVRRCEKGDIKNAMPK